jgi:hypothetical protein
MLVRRSIAVLAAAGLLAGLATPLAAQPAPKPAPAAAMPAPPAGGFDPARLKPLTNADFARMPSGCSFEVKRGKESIAISFIDEEGTGSGATRSFWMKPDGKLVEVKGKAVKAKPNDQSLGVWTGTLQGLPLRIVEGKAGKGPVGDGGGTGGGGTLEWGAPGAGGKLPIKWAAGC